MRLARRVAAIGLAALLAGCTTLPRPQVEGETLSGRIAVRVEAQGGTPTQSVSGSFELQGTSQAGRLSLTSPIGTTVAQARWDGRRATLVTSDGETQYDDLNALTRDMLGESLPVAALFDWLRGHPWPDAPSQPAPGGFRQLGWTVDLARFDEGWVLATRERPQVNVRARLDRP